MLIRKSPDLRYSQVTPKQAYLDRRQFLAGSIALATFSGARLAQATKLPGVTKSPLSTTEPPTDIKYITHYNNFYELGTDKGDPAENAARLHTSPWSVKVEGEVAKPKILDLDAIMKIAPLEERIYRHRCVERWSIVVPWIGFSLSTLLKQVQPTGKAKYVAFETYFDPKQMLSPREAGIPFPYVEGLRLDEAMHPLTLLSFGMYGETLPNQNGTPIRLVIPWKYGYKSIKSITRIRFVEKEPPTDWGIYSTREYGFYSNVNPEVPHPRWPQNVERRLGGGFLGQGMEIPTVKFNGYGDQVASLYSGMDLVKFH
jgi:sulfoxide reductase catalytic subunit YedY